MTLKEKLNTKVYSLETGYLLPKEDKEYEAYSNVYDKQNAYYDELQCYIVGNLHEILNELEQQFKKQHLANEYMILKFECLVQNFASLELEDIEKMTLEQIETFLNEECFDTDDISYDLESIVWSAYKDENGIIHEDFIKKEMK
jgi:hypothetical protein